MYVVPDGDGWFFDENKSKKYADVRKKLLNAEGEITFEEYQEKADQIAPIEKFDKVPEPTYSI